MTTADQTIAGFDTLEGTVRECMLRILNRYTAAVGDDSVSAEELAAIGQVGTGNDQREDVIAVIEQFGFSGEAVVERCLRQDLFLADDLGRLSLTRKSSTIMQAIMPVAQAANAAWLAGLATKTENAQDIGRLLVALQKTRDRNAGDDFGT